MNQNPLEFTVAVCALGFGGWLLGHGVDRLVGVDSGVLRRLVINAVVLYCMIVLLPNVSVMHETLPGIMSLVLFVIAQHWP